VIPAIHKAQRGSNIGQMRSSIRMVDERARQIVIGAADFFDLQIGPSEGGAGRRYSPFIR
jgi:hypothetical protein